MLCLNRRRSLEADRRNWKLMTSPLSQSSFLNWNLLSNQLPQLISSWIASLGKRWCVCFNSCFIVLLFGFTLLLHMHLFIVTLINVHWIRLKEQKQLSTVLNHPAFQVDPLAAIHQHLESTQPVSEEKPKKKTNKTARKKKKGDRSKTSSGPKSMDFWLWGVDFHGPNSFVFGCEKVVLINFCILLTLYVRLIKTSIMICSILEKLSVVNRYLNPAGLTVKKNIWMEFLFAAPRYFQHIAFYVSWFPNLLHQIWPSQMLRN